MITATIIMITMAMIIITPATTGVDRAFGLDIVGVNIIVEVGIIE